MRKFLTGLTAAVLLFSFSTVSFASSMGPTKPTVSITYTKHKNEKAKKFKKEQKSKTKKHKQGPTKYRHSKPAPHKWHR